MGHAVPPVAARPSTADSSRQLRSQTPHRGCYGWHEVNHAQNAPFVFGLQWGARKGQSASPAHMMNWFELSHDPVQYAPPKSIAPG